ncbi:MAG: hypothetical protein K0R07_172 [Sedimentibacter sp.]|jgi:hypothetical protein|nr:hypothetical protein [Sedimentibacter sp.]
MGLLKSLSGYTAKTAENLVLDAGAFFKNFDVKADTYDTAVTAGKLLGATRGGGNFNATPTVRQVEVDGVKGEAKGLTVIDSWKVTMTANMLEVTIESLKLSLASATSAVDAVNYPGYTQIKANNYISLADYIDNITWVGTISGSDKPVIIQIYNVLNTNGLSIQTQDKSEVVTALTLTGHYDDADLDSPPFAIYYPTPAA